jgi:C-terminal processing protease CtpA/Prc
MPDAAHPIKGRYFEAATFDTRKGPMGYVRIPDFVPGDVDKARKEMRRVLKDIWYTKGLVLDLTDNPGGLITYCYGLATNFVPRPLQMPTVSLRASRSTLADYLEWEDWSGDPLRKQLLKYSIEQLRVALDRDQAMTDFGPGRSLVPRAR